MVVKNDELIQELAKKVNKDEAWVRKELAVLVEEIKTRTSSGDTVGIDNFGTFSDKSDRLSFDIDETFALEINYKYAGMEPIELVSAIDEQEETPDETEGKSESSEKSAEKEEPEKTELAQKDKELEKDDVFGIENGTGKTGEKDKEKGPVESAKKEESKDAGKEEKKTTKKDTGKSDKSDAEKRWEEAFGIIEPDLTDDIEKPSKSKSTPEPSKTESEKKISPEKEPPKQIEAPKKTEPVKTGSAATKTAGKGARKTPLAKTVPSKRRKSRSKYPHHQRSGSSSVLLMILVVAVILAGGLYLVYPEFYNSGNKPVARETPVAPKQDESNQPAQSKPEPVAPSAGNGSNNTKGNNNPAQANNNEANSSAMAGNTRARSDVKETNKIISDLQNVSQYGLKGHGLSNKNNFYGIILYSLSANTNAKKQQSKLSNMGYRAFIMPVQVGGQQYWRVGVGQFPDVASAKKAITLLPDPYQKNHFIKYIHIQPNQ